MPWRFGNKIVKCLVQKKSWKIYCYTFKMAKVRLGHTVMKMCHFMFVFFQIVFVTMTNVLLECWDYLFCRRAWWKVGCPDWVSSHTDSSWKKCRQANGWSSARRCDWLHFVPKMDEGCEKIASQATRACYQSNLNNLTPGFITSKRNLLLQMRLQVSKGHFYAN